MQSFRCKYNGIKILGPPGACRNCFFSQLFQVELRLVKGVLNFVTEHLQTHFKIRARKDCCVTSLMYFRDCDVGPAQNFFKFHSYLGVHVIDGKCDSITFRISESRKLLLKRTLSQFKLPVYKCNEAAGYKRNWKLTKLPCRVTYK